MSVQQHSLVIIKHKKCSIRRFTVIITEYLFKKWEEKKTMKEQQKKTTQRIWKEILRKIKDYY